MENNTKSHEVARLTYIKKGIECVLCLRSNGTLDTRFFFHRFYGRIRNHFKDKRVSREDLREFSYMMRRYADEDSPNARGMIAAFEWFTDTSLYIGLYPDHDLFQLSNEAHQSDSMFVPQMPEVNEEDFNRLLGVRGEDGGGGNRLNTERAEQEWSSYRYRLNDVRQYLQSVIEADREATGRHTNRHGEETEVVSRSDVRFVLDESERLLQAWTTDEEGADVFLSEHPIGETGGSDDPPASNDTGEVGRPELIGREVGVLPEQGFLRIADAGESRINRIGIVIDARVDEIRIRLDNGGFLEARCLAHTDVYEVISMSGSCELTTNDFRMLLNRRRSERMRVNNLPPHLEPDELMIADATTRAEEATIENIEERIEAALAENVLEPLNESVGAAPTLKPNIHPEHMKSMWKMARKDNDTSDT